MTFAKFGYVIIVAGSLTVDPANRSTYLDNCRAVIEVARATPGCLDFSLSADLLEPGRINVFEAWENVETLEAFRGSGTDEDHASQITAAVVHQYEVAASTNLTG